MSSSRILVVACLSCPSIILTAIGRFKMIEHLIETMCIVRVNIIRRLRFFKNRGAVLLPAEATPTPRDSSFAPNSAPFLTEKSIKLNRRNAGLIKSPPPSLYSFSISTSDVPFLSSVK